MTDEKTGVTTDRPVSNKTPRNQPVVDLFPVQPDRKMMAMAGMRQPANDRVGTQISIFSPVSFEEAVSIVECLQSRAATTISLENMKKVDAGRLVDFVAGASAALDGDFHKLNEQVYLFCPSNIKITAFDPDERQEAAASDLGALDFLTGFDSSNNSSVWTQSQSRH